MEPLCQEIDNSIIKKITLPYTSTWNDIGSFGALYNELDKNNDNNILKGNITTINTNNCYIESIKPIAATIDIHNLVIIDTEDVLLICDKDNTQKVKDMVNIFKKEKALELLYHNTVLQPWGSSSILKNNKELLMKQIIIYPGKHLTLQGDKSKHLIITKGYAIIRIDNKKLFKNKNEYIYFPSNILYDIENIGLTNLEFIETQITNDIDIK
jgi:mannose-6-phosphate isomerase-like protein (cupin superfamily)